MQASMNYAQMNMVQRNIMMAQAESSNLQATNILMSAIQFNALLKDDEAESGVSSTEDLGKYKLQLTLFFSL
jgi:hypothetical protein